MARKNLPTYRLHKPSGQAVVTLKGKDFYLGKYKSKASREAYEKIIAEYLANGKETPPTRTRNEISVEELSILFMQYAESYYRKNGKPTDTVFRCQISVSPVVQYYGTQPVSVFGPLALKYVREKMIESGLARETINTRINVIRQMFAWGVENEYVPADILTALKAVKNLMKGRTIAPDLPDVEPVSAETVDATIPFLPSIVADMVRIQRYALMRPQDIRNMRLCDIDARGPVWKYTPFTHKTEHRGKTREIPLGPRSQAILASYLIDKQDTPEAFLFSPSDSEQARKVVLREKRKTKVQPSQEQRNAQRKENQKKVFHSQYSKDAYARVITRACEKAGVDHWSPNQLRHAGATEVRNEYSLDQAQAALGHSHASTTEIYAKINFEKAAKVALEIG